MGLKLRAGISFCDVSDRLLFLDIVADRYFCLGDETERAFRKLIGQDHAFAESRALAGLLRSGILAETPGIDLPRAVPAVGVATASLLDDSVRHVPVRQAAAALSFLAFAHLSLRFGRLHSVLRTVADAKARVPVAPETARHPMRDIAAAFEWTARIVRSHDQCLPRSIALARRLAASGLPADLVIGVRLRPFAAHSWVQAGPWLVNDRLDAVRTYTPILSV